MDKFKEFTYEEQDELIEAEVVVRRMNEMEKSIKERYKESIKQVFNEVGLKTTLALTAAGTATVLAAMFSSTNIIDLNTIIRAFAYTVSLEVAGASFLGFAGINKTNVDLEYPDAVEKLQEAGIYDLVMESIKINSDRERLEAKYQKDIIPKEEYETRHKEFRKKDRQICRMIENVIYNRNEGYRR